MKFIALIRLPLLIGLLLALAPAEAFAGQKSRMQASRATPSHRSPTVKARKPSFLKRKFRSWFYLSPETERAIEQGSLVYRLQNNPRSEAVLTAMKHNNLAGKTHQLVIGQSPRLTIALDADGRLHAYDRYNRGRSVNRNLSAWEAKAIKIAEQAYLEWFENSATESTVSMIAITKIDRSLAGAIDRAASKRSGLPSPFDIIDELAR